MGLVGGRRRHNEAPSSFKQSRELIGTSCWLLNVSKMERDFQALCPSCWRCPFPILLASVINGDELVHSVRQRQLFTGRD